MYFQFSARIPRQFSPNNMLPVTTSQAGRAYILHYFASRDCVRTACFLGTSPNPCQTEIAFLPNMSAQHLGPQQSRSPRSTPALALASI